jgi:hypothetical protein
VSEGRDLPRMDTNGKADPYALVKFCGKQFKTTIVDRNLHPVWDADFTFIVDEDNKKAAKEDACVKVEIYDHDTLGADDFIGTVFVLVAELKKSGGQSGWYPLRNKDFSVPKGLVGLGFVHLTLVYAAAADDRATALDEMMQLHTIADCRAGKHMSSSAAAKPLRLFIGTWNVGNAQPPDDFTGFLKTDYDIVVIGAQECKYKPGVLEPPVDSDDDTDDERGDDDSDNDDVDSDSDDERASVKLSSVLRKPAAKQSVMSKKVEEGDEDGGDDEDGDGDDDTVGELAPVKRSKRESEIKSGGGGGDKASRPSVNPMAKVSKKCDTHWTDVLSNFLGDEYELVGAKNLWQLRLRVFVNKRIMHRVSGIDTGVEATGIGHVLGNKGGVVVAMQVDALWLCFVNSHLAAHQVSFFANLLFVAD